MSVNKIVVQVARLRLISDIVLKSIHNSSLLYGFLLPPCLILSAKKQHKLLNEHNKSPLISLQAALTIKSVATSVLILI